MRSRLIDQLHDHLRTHAVRAMTFDVFDTFLLRGCTAPDGVYELAARYAPVASSRPGVIDSYVQHRQQAEAKAHIEAKQATGSPEIPIADIYANFPLRLFGLNRTTIRDLIAAEFRAEVDLCCVNPDMAALYAEARRLGLKVGFISDTYWTAEELGELLRGCQPELHWDFLYTSCDYATGKSEALFKRLLIEQGFRAPEVLHIGDNDKADIRGAERFGIAAIHVPQATDDLAAVLQREHTAFRLLTNTTHGARLDKGLCAVRRVIAARANAGPAAFRLGVEVLGPVMAAFDRFVAHRIARLADTGKNIAVAFLARDGMLSFDIWQASRADRAHYLEINRRVALMASATSWAPLVKLFSHFPAVDEPTVAAILKIQSPRLSAFFREFAGGQCSGQEFAEAMPGLLNAGEREALAADMRRNLLAYLRAAIPDLDTVTDLVLVDLGYCASIQKALRRVFDREGIRARLHGLYLLSFDDAFTDLADTDTAEGFISDLVVKPRVNRVLARNAAILEHACCAPKGSVRGYQDGTVLYEPDPRPADQLAMCTKIQAGVLHFIKRLAELTASEGLDPFIDLQTAAAHTAAILARFLLLPTDDELQLLGSMKHDINLGTQTLVATADPGAADRLNVALALPSFCAAPEPPMWIAGTMTALSPVHGFLYALFGASQLPGDIFGDVKCGTIDIAAISAGEVRSFAVSCFRSGFGEIRIRIPVSRTLGTLAISIPLARLASEGLIAGMTIQTGKTIAEAMSDRHIKCLPRSAQTGIGIALSGAHYRTVEAERHELLVRLPVLRHKIGIVTILIKPLTDSRVLALADRSAQSTDQISLDMGA
jgi:FMN phosphatase YigB (HAD superfamily)